MEKAQQKIDYTSTYPNICYYASDMILHLDSDAVYLVAPQKPEVVLQATFILVIHPNRNSLSSMKQVKCKPLCHVVACVAEAKTVGLYHNTQMAILTWTILHTLNYPQPPTQLKIDNSTVNGFAHANIHQKTSKS